MSSASMHMSRARAVGRLICLGLLLSLLVWPRGARATVDGVVNGVVRDESLNPLSGAVVKLHDPRGATAQQVRTDKDGGFAFRGVPLGDYTVEATAQGRLQAHEHIQVSSSAVTSLELFCVVPAASTNIIETPEVQAPSRAVGTALLLRRETLRSLPKGEDRPITEVLSTQPGFILDAFGNVYVRGNHANVQYQVDGIPIPDSVGNLFAQGLPVRLIDNLEVLTGGMPAEFGNRLAAVVNISSRHGGEAPEGQVQVRYGSFHTVEPSLSYARTMKGVSLFFGGSYLSTQRGLDPPSNSPILHDDGQSGRLFLRLDLRPTASDRVELFASYAYNFFQIPIDPTVGPLDPSRPDLGRPVDPYGNAAPPYVPRDTDATETEHELFAALSLVHTFSARAQVQVAPYYKQSYGALLADAQRALGPSADPGSIASDAVRRAEHTGGVVHGSLHLRNHLLKAGVQIDYLRGVTDFVRYLRDDAVGGVDPLGTVRGTDRTAALLTGAYVQDRWERGRLALSLGLRVDHQHVFLADGQSDDQVGVSPRLGASFAFLPELVGHVATGVNWQPPAPLDAGNAARALGVVPADQRVPYDVRAETDVYGELGLDLRLWKRLRLGAAAWGRYAWDQLDDVAVGSTNLVANYNFQRGRALGVEGKLDLVVRDFLTGFANASWQIAEGQGIASARYLFDAEQLADESWQTLDHAQTFTANVGATLRHKGAAFTALFAYGSGLRTGPTNQASVPASYRVDATLQYAFADLPLRPVVAMDIVNLLDAQYAYRIANGFVGSSYAAPRSVFLRVALPLTR